MLRSDILKAALKQLMYTTPGPNTKKFSRFAAGLEPTTFWIWSQIPHPLSYTPPYLDFRARQQPSPTETAGSESPSFNPAVKSR